MYDVSIKYANEASTLECTNCGFKSQIYQVMLEHALIHQKEGLSVRPYHLKFLIDKVNNNKTKVA